jgi:hypothetical protein
MNKSRLIKVIFNLIICFSLIIFYFLIISVIRNRLDVPQKYALLVGGGITERDDNESFYNNIEYVSNVLKRLNYKNKNVKILFYGDNSKFRPIVVADATRKNFIDELRHFEKTIDSNDSLLIFRSGHGTIELVDEKYGILSVDKEIPRIRITRIIGTAAVMSFPDGQLSYLEFQDRLKRIKAGQIVVILNQCYLGQFTEITSKLDNTVVVSETEDVELAFFSNRKTKSWDSIVWPYVKCMFDGFLIKEHREPNQSVFAAFEYMLSCNPNIMGLPVMADRPLLRENPQIKYGRGLKRGGVYISNRENYNYVIEKLWPKPS